MYFKRKSSIFSLLPFGFVSVLFVEWLHGWALADKETKVVDAQGKPLSRGTDEGMAYANFERHKFSFLNITTVRLDQVDISSECGFACVNMPSCFSFNLASFHDINGKVLCELLPSDIYNNSNKLIPSQSHHHYSIASPCISWPCQNNGKCAAQYEKNSYVCVCVSGYTGEHCETDIDECSASIRPCDVNANCQNTDGSYSCSCKSGFSGNGKICQDIDECGASIRPCAANANCQNSYGSYSCSCKSGYSGNGKACADIDECSATIRPCDVDANCQNTDGSYSCSCKSGFIGNGKTCKGWTLIARFSNSDGTNWMRDDGKWWYDQKIAIGATKDTSGNSDMISTAFWSLSGSEMKITRSDDPSHTPLLQTTGNCLSGQTFRSKITRYGDFRNGKVWADDKCLGNCAVRYGGHYKSTDGFQQANCSGDIQGANKIGFWCNWGADGSVMMIGGGGKECDRADHGIGITEANDASFDDKGLSEQDFGYGAGQGTPISTTLSQSYSLNLWIR